MTKEDIKQICQIYDNFRSERDAATIAYNSDNAFWEHVLATYNLSHPSLPSGLDEAAERIVVSLVPTFGQKYEDGSYVKGIRDYFSRDEFIGLVKAGAEWMAEQGVSMEYEVEDKCLELGYGSLPGLGPIINLPDSFKPSDKVVVQIRKKE